MASTEWPSHYIAEKPFFNPFGRTFKIFSGGALRFYVRQKMFRLKEAINVYADERMDAVRLRIKARNVIDFAATYDVTDAEDGALVGSLARKGFRSMLRDTWVIVDPDGNPFGEIREDSALTALIRRIFLSLIPQTFHVSVHGTQVGVIKQRFNLFKIVYDVSIPPDRLDPRLSVAASVLIMAIEGRQQ